MPQRPDGAIYLQGYGDYYWLPGLAVPASPSGTTGSTIGAGNRPSRGRKEQPFSFAAPRPKSQSMRFGSPATTRMGTGAFIR